MVPVPSKLGGTGSVSGNPTFVSLTVSGVTTLNGALNSGSAIGTTGTVSAGTVSATTVSAGTLGVSGNATVNGSLTIGSLAIANNTVSWPASTVLVGGSKTPSSNYVQIVASGGTGYLQICY